MSFIHIRLPDLETLSQKATSGLKSEKETYDSMSELDDGWQTGFIGTHFYVPLGIDEEDCQVLQIRMFGSREDPATGSAASGLAAYLSLMAKEAIAQGEKSFRYRLVQGVEMGRKSEIGVQVLLNEEGDGVGSIVLSGSAVKVMEGTLEV